MGTMFPLMKKVHWQQAIVLCKVPSTITIMPNPLLEFNFEAFKFNEIGSDHTIQTPSVIANKQGLSMRLIAHKLYTVRSSAR
jgi:hypothetical protein